METRVLFIGPLPQPVTGQSLACKVFLDELVKENEVELVNLSKAAFRQGISSGSRIAEVASILWSVWKKRTRAAVIYLTVSESSTGNLKDLFIYLLCYRRLSRMIIHLHGGAGMKGIMQGGGLRRRANAFFLKRLGGVVVLGQTHVPIYRGIVPEARIHVVPNFAEDDFFTTTERIDSKFLATSPLRLLFLSNLLPGKGHEELVEAFFALDSKTRTSIKIDFAGGFETTKQKERFVARIAGVENIRYHGTVAGERKRHLLDQAHVFCLPTYYPYEGQPISILEGYASGCAVITTDHSGIPDVFRDDVNGFQVAKRSVLDLQRAIERAVAEPERLRLMAMTNLRTALGSYRAADYNKALTEIVGSLAGVH